jgi:hypothetical protein
MSNNEIKATPNGGAMVTSDMLGTVQRDKKASEFVCSFCKRAFSTNTGLSVHQRVKHKEAYHLAHQPAPHTKPRWDPEDNIILANAEVSILLGNKQQDKKNINKALASIFPSRSLDAIKSHRKSSLYQQLVKDRFV